MPARTAPKWKQRIFDLKASYPHLGAPTILATIRTEAQKAGETDAPSLSVVTRMLREWERPETPREEYGFLYWPCNTDDLPWAAGNSVLELLRLSFEIGIGRPTKRVGKWWWRLQQACPDLQVKTRIALAHQLAVCETLGLIDAEGNPKAPSRSTYYFDLWLSCEAVDYDWSSMWNRVSQAGDVPPWIELRWTSGGLLGLLRSVTPERFQKEVNWSVYDSAFSRLDAWLVGKDPSETFFPPPTGTSEFLVTLMETPESRKGEESDGG